jgi:Na+-transporting methylmalonyl-CoA/oxaloacetate decarboxylase gamma subunit
LIFLSVAGPVMSLLRESPHVPLSLIIAFSIGVLVLVWTVGVYKDRLHRIRAGGNCIVLVLLMTGAILSNKFYEKLGVGVVLAALTVIMLSVTLIGNVVVLSRVECNKKSKSAYSSEKEMQDMIDELGMANMAFLGDIGNRSYCHDRTDRLLGDHLSSLISEDDHPKFACKIEDKINELRNFKMSVVHPEAMVNEMINCEGFLDWDVDCPPSKPQQQDDTKLISTPRQKVEGRM